MSQAITFQLPSLYQQQWHGLNQPSQQGVLHEVAASGVAVCIGNVCTNPIGERSFSCAGLCWLDWPMAAECTAAEHTAASVKCPS
jgi:hypothetical protein